MGALTGFLSSLVCVNSVLAAPSITFSADSTVIPIGSSTDLNWSVTDAVSCEASGEWSGSKDNESGSENTGALTAGVKTFTLTCLDSGSDSATTNVNVVVADPPTLDFSAEANEIDYNTQARLLWSSTNASSCEKYGDWSGSTSLSGDELTENLISEKIFGVRCTGAGGMIEKTVTITISNPTLQVELDFVADNMYIDWDTSTVLRWSATNADFCTASGAWSGSRDKESGSYTTANLTSNKTYTLHCENSSGSSVTKNITIVVSARTPMPVTVDATADDINIDYNTPATIRWTSHNADRCRVYYGSWTGDLAANGSYTSSNLVNDRTFRVRCYSWDDTTDDTVTINVGENPAPPPTLDFSADNTSLDYNTATDLNWTATDTTSLSASGDWSGGKMIPSGSESTGDLLEDGSYTLRATGDGGTVTEVVNVSVGDPVLPPDLDVTVDDASVAYNQPTVVRWSSEHSDWCRLKYNSTDIPVGPDGNRYTGNLIENTTYTVTCGNEADRTSKAATVEVIPVGFPPDITLTADTNPVPYGTGTTIRWTTSNARVCTLSGVGAVDINGSRATSNLYLPITYTLTCTGDGGTASRNLTINIIGTPDAPPTLNFWADDYNFYGNGTTTLHWTATDADRCWASRGPWSGDKATPSGVEDTRNLTATTLYEISCENVNGRVSRSLTITVDEANDVEIEFYADNYEIERNGNVTLTWNGKNANWCESYSYPEYSDWGQFDRQTADREDSKTIGPITEYSNTFYLRCWNYTSNSNWQRLNVVAGEHPPSISMSVPYTVAYNSPATISWFADYSESCTAWSNPAEPTWDGPREVSGLQLTSNLTETTYFYLECENSEGKTTQVYRRVSVGAASGNPPQLSFTSDKYIAEEGEEYTVSWDATNAYYCMGSSNPVGVYSEYVYDYSSYPNGTNLSSSQTVTFSGDQQELLVTCLNRYGSMTAIVRVNRGGTELNVPSISFWADEMSLPVNGNTTLRWRVENAESCTASNGWSGAKASAGGQERTANLATTTRFELHCSNVAGSRTAFVDVVVGGPPPDVSINFNASRYDVPAGNSTTLTWSADNASYCYATDPNGDFVGGKTTSGSHTLFPSVSTTYKLVCGNSGGERTATVEIVVAKVIVCPNPARIIDTGSTTQLRAWFMQDADAAFSCSNTSGAVDITSGYGGFSTDWSSPDDSVISVDGSGLATGHDYTDNHGGPLDIAAEYKEAVGTSTVYVVPPPVTCWTCTEARTCSSEVTFPLDGNCADGYYDTMYECAKSCRKPVDWQEAGS